MGLQQFRLELEYVLETSIERMFFCRGFHKAPAYRVPFCLWLGVKFCSVGALWVCVKYARI